MIVRDVRIVGTSDASYKRGQEAYVAGVRMVTPSLDLPPRLCFIATYEDGDVDYIPVDDKGTYSISPVSHVGGFVNEPDEKTAMAEEPTPTPRQHLIDRIGKLTNVTEIQCMDGTWDYSDYHRGLANGLILACSIMEGHNKPVYKEATPITISTSITKHRQQRSIMLFDCVDGTAGPYPTEAEQYRDYHGAVTWVYNPWTGKKRDLRDVGSDVFGHLILPPGEAVVAATPEDTEARQYDPKTPLEHVPTLEEKYSLVNTLQDYMQLTHRIFKVVESVGDSDNESTEAIKQLKIMLSNYADTGGQQITVDEAASRLTKAAHEDADYAIRIFNNFKSPIVNQGVPPYIADRAARRLMESIFKIDIINNEQYNAAPMPPPHSRAANKIAAYDLIADNNLSWIELRAKLGLLVFEDVCRELKKDRP